MTTTYTTTTRVVRGARAGLRGLLFAAALAAVPAGLYAQEAGDARSGAGQEATPSGPVEPHPEAQEAIGRLKSPFCPGLMLEVCPSRQAADLRDTLETMARSGIGADSLVAWTLARYGEEWRAVPEARGGGLLAWIVPPLAILVGGGLVVLVLRRMRAKGSDRIEIDGERELSEEDRQRLAEAMSQLEREGH